MWTVQLRSTVATSLVIHLAHSLLASCPWNCELTSRSTTDSRLGPVSKGSDTCLPSSDMWEQLISCTYIHTQMHTRPWDQEWAMVYHSPLLALEETWWRIWWGRLGTVGVHPLWDVCAQEDAKALLQESSVWERHQLCGGQQPWLIGAGLCNDVRASRNCPRGFIHIPEKCYDF